MNTFEDLLKQFDLNFFGTGSHKISLEKAMSLKQENKAVFIDVRSKEELAYVSFGFASNIPISELPQRINEIPEDKTVVLFCASGPRATIAYAFLQVNGYKNARILTDGLGDIASYFKPRYVLKNQKDLMI